MPWFAKKFLRQPTTLTSESVPLAKAPGSDQSDYDDEQDLKNLQHEVDGEDQTNQYQKQDSTSTLRDLELSKFCLLFSTYRLGSTRFELVQDLCNCISSCYGWG